MNPEQKKILRDALVAALVTASPVSLPLETLRATARNAGFPITSDELKGHLEYIVGKGVAEAVTPELSAAATRWKATAAGTDYAEQEGLV